MLILIATNVLSIIIIIYLIISNMKLKAINTRLSVENNNLQYELGKCLVKEQTNLDNEENDFYNSKIGEIKEKYRSTSEIDFGKEATKEDVENFYREQINKKD